MREIKSRDEAYSFLAEAAIYGNLGLFIGAGFSKAVLNKPGGAIALSWRDLIANAAQELGLNFAAAEQPGTSYPQIASALCRSYADLHGVTYPIASSKLKAAIANLTSWYPDKESRQEFSEYLEGLSPAWIITTNYDLIIESLLTGASLSLGPQDRLISPADITPVYHLHGVRTNPASIVVTQEDYVALFRPNEYRQVKLALTIKESTTLILGYGLGDVNVLTAVDWSRNVFAEEAVNYPSDIVQVVRHENPREEPYRDPNDVLILETDELSTFLLQFCEALVLARDEHENEIAELKKVRDELDDPSAVDISDFIDNEESRREMLSMLAEYESHLISGFLNFFTRCIDETWHRAAPPGAFHAYNENLRMLMDILTALEVRKMPPALFQLVAYSLDRVFPFIGTAKGKSWEAAQTWHQRKSQLSHETVEELCAIARQSQYFRLEAKLREMIYQP